MRLDEFGDALIEGRQSAPVVLCERQKISVGYLPMTYQGQTR